MRNKYILLEMNQRNEIRAHVNMKISPYDSMNQEYLEALSQHFEI